MFGQKFNSLAVAAASLTVAAVASFGPAAAQQYPTHSITVIVAAAAGGYADTVARVIGDKLGSKLGQNVVVENRGGAAGNIGAKVVADSKPDGYTILVTTTALAINETLYKNRGYTAKDLKAAAIPVSAPEVIVANPANPAKNLAELIKNNKTITYGSAGIGTGSYLEAEYLFKKIAHVDTIHVPFPGGAPAINAILGNHVGVLAVTVPPVIPLINQGKLRGLGIAAPKRMELVKSIPTYGEQGFPNYYASSWVGFFVPAKTPDAVLDKLNSGINATLKDPAVLARLNPFGVEMFSRTPADTASYLASEIATWGKMVKELGLSIK